MAFLDMAGSSGCGGGEVGTCVLPAWSDWSLSVCVCVEEEGGGGGMRRRGGEEGGGGGGGRRVGKKIMPV